MNQWIKKTFLLTILISLSFTLGYVSKGFVLGQEIKHPTSEYNKLIQLLETQFEFKGYQQILKQSDSIIVVPDELNGRQDFKNGLYDRQKSFIYKDRDKGVVILLGVSSNAEWQSEKDWTHSIGYSPVSYNQKDNFFKDSYSEKFPNTEVYTYAFSGKGYNLTMTAFSKDSGNKLLAVNELANFTREIIRQLKPNL